MAELLREATLSDMTLVDPCPELLPSFIEGLRAGTFSYMALGQHGDEPADVIERDPAGYLERVLDRSPREVRTPDGQVFLLSDHALKWAVAAGVFIAGVSFRTDTDNELLEKYSGHVGMSVRADMRDRGYGTAVWRLVLDYFCSRGFQEIVASADVDNLRSAHVMKKIGGRIVDRRRAFGFNEAWIFRIPTCP